MLWATSSAPVQLKLSIAYYFGNSGERKPGRDLGTLNSKACRTASLHTRGSLQAWRRFLLCRNNQIRKSSRSIKFPLRFTYRVWAMRTLCKRHKGTLAMSAYDESCASDGKHHVQSIATSA